MNAALAMHHAAVRKLLDKCGGYESSTEGDGFITAFHTPTDALTFAQVRPAAGAHARVLLVPDRAPHHHLHQHVSTRAAAP